MKIAAYVTINDQKGTSSFKRFVVETLFLLTHIHFDHTYIIIAERKPQRLFRNNVEIIIKRPPENILSKKVWSDITIPATLRKLKADLFISFDDTCSLRTSIPQIMVIDTAEEIRSSYLKKARLLIVNSKLARKQLVDKFDIAKETIWVIYPSADKDYKTISIEEKEQVKKKYSEEKEYFLYNSVILKNDDLIDLLKSFSHFKKRQQSNFKLLLLSNSTPSFEKTLRDYKFRADVKFIRNNDKSEQVLITAAAYAVILPSDIKKDQIACLNAMQAGVPVITPENSLVKEMAGDAVLYSESGSIKDFGEKMMQVYTDENYRSALIKKGSDVANNFSREKATELIWQAIMTALE